MTNEPCSAKWGFDAYLQCMILSKWTCNYGSMKSIWSNNQVNHEIKWLFDMKIIITQQKVLIHVNLRRQHRLIWIKTCAHQCINPHFDRAWLIWNRLTLSPNKPWFLRDCITSLLKTLFEREKLLCNEQFLLFPLSTFSFSQCFPSIWRNFCHFRQFWNCRLYTLSF